MAAATVGPTAQAGVESCTYDPATKSVSAAIADGSSATLKVENGELWFGLVPSACGVATTANTDSISVTGSAGTTETLVLDHRGGAFGPGATPEFNVPEIEIAAYLGDTTDRVVIYGTDEKDHMSSGTNGLALNSDGDVDVVVTPSVFVLEVHLYEGADYFNGRGEGGAGLAFRGPITIYGGPGDDPYLRGSVNKDVIDGGPGNDIIYGEADDDFLDGGEGDDELRAGDGADVLLGGPGSDTFIGSAGDDVMHAEDDEADASFSGGSGSDTLYYDEQVDPTPIAIEYLIGDGGPPPPPPPAGSCAYDAASKSATASIQPGQSSTLTVVSGAIHFGATPMACGDATTLNTDSITVSGAGGTVETLTLDLAGGPFAPGFASEGTGTPEIEIAVALGDASDVIVVRGGPGPDAIRMGQNGLAVNGDTDVDVTFAPLPAQIEIIGGGGVNTLTGTGGFGAGSAFLGKVILRAGDSGDLLSGGSGNDELYGGAGNDTLEGNNGNDVLDGGAGDDILKGGSDDDVLIGGSGADQFIGSSGDDTFHAGDGERDASINGGPGVDTAYYDLGIDPAPLATENRVPV